MPCVEVSHIVPVAVFVLLTTLGDVFPTRLVVIFQIRYEYLLVCLELEVGSRLRHYFSRNFSFRYDHMMNFLRTHVLLEN